MKCQDCCQSAHAVAYAYLQNMPCMRKYLQDVCGKVSVFYLTVACVQRNYSLIYTSVRQVFLSYGPLPSLRALLFYGFALKDNPHDTLALTFEARPSSGIAW